MIKITKNLKDEYTSGNITKVFEEVDAVLQKRQSIQERYLRGITSTNPAQDGSVQIFFEKFITDLAAGYLSGDITYNAEIIDDAEKKAYSLLHPSSKNKPLDADTAAQLKYILTTLSAKNDDPKVLKSLFHDAVLFGAAYERQLDINDPTQTENKSDPNYTYYPLSALNTVAIFPTDINDIQQQNAIGLISVYTLDARNSEDNQEHTLYYCIECNPYTNNYVTTTFDKTTKQDATAQYKDTINLKEEKAISHNIPTFSVFEPDPQISIIDPIISLVTAYENIMNNLNNMYKYNDTDAKLKVSGYRPENPLTIPNPAFDPEKPVSASNPEVISNPAREIEDNNLMNSKTFFVQEGGDVSWLLKEIHAEDATKYLKYYVDSIFQISGIPNTNDAAFNSGDLNASAIDRKFYTMALMLDDVRQGVVTLIKHRWRNFLARINLLSGASGTHYNIDDISITIGTNLPSMTDENINQQLALNGIISQKTLLSNLGYDYATERKNKEEETEVAHNFTAPDTPYVTPGKVGGAFKNTPAPTPAAGQTNNQVPNQTNATQTVVKDKTDNIHKTQVREGRPNK